MKSTPSLQRPAVLVVDDNAAARESIALVLREAGYATTMCGSGSEALAQVKRGSYGVVVTDLQMPGMSGLELIRELMRGERPPQVLMITAHASVKTAVEAMQLGAFDFLEKPFDAQQLEDSVARACLHASLRTPELPATVTNSPLLVGSSPAMQQLRQQIARIAETDETVLICGESGTGKELVAQSLHAQSRRANAALVSLNCPVLSEQLTESELFGHRRGAFTGADRDRTGRFEAAHGGTLLLDEVTEITPQLQAKLLRVLQERTFEPVGSSTTISVDVRVLATTNRDLRQEVAVGRFREDLYYRLAVVPIATPPLRARGNDVMELATHFLTASRARLARPELEFESSVCDLFASYHWPGNVRELHNVVTRATVLAAGNTIGADLVRPWLLTQPAAAERPAAVPVGMSLAEIERQMILATLEQFAGHRQKTADALGIGVRTLSGKLRELGVAPGERMLARTG